MSAAPPCVRALAFAKINVTLELVARRTDGFHEIRTVFQTIDLCDELELRPAPELRLSIEGAPGLGSGADNLVTRAARALAGALGRDAGADILLRKRIPVGGGLGGGSSDAAAALTGLALLWDADPGAGVMHELAAGLGSDVPFFLVGGRCAGSGRGEILEPLEDTAETTLLLVTPPVQASTAAVFRAASVSLTARGGFSNIAPSIATSGEAQLAALADVTRDDPQSVSNDLQDAAFSLYPEIRQCYERLRNLGARTVRMSGSGASLFAHFADASAERTATEALAGDARIQRVRTVGRAEYRARQLSWC